MSGSLIGSAWVVLNVVDPSVDALIYNLTDGFQVLPSRIYNLLVFVWITDTVQTHPGGALVRQRTRWAEAAMARRYLAKSAVCPRIDRKALSASASASAIPAALAKPSC